MTALDVRVRLTLTAYSSSRRSCLCSFSSHVVSSRTRLNRGPKTGSNTITTDDTSRSPLGSTTEQLALAPPRGVSRTHGPPRALLLDLNRPFVLARTPTACLRTAVALLLFGGSSSDAPESDSESESRGKPVMDFTMLPARARLSLLCGP